MPDIVGAVVGVGFLVLWIYCIYDVITTDDAIIQHLPKVLWILIVVLLSDLGSLLWLGLGRPRVWGTCLSQRPTLSSVPTEASLLWRIRWGI